MGSISTSSDYTFVSPEEIVTPVFEQAANAQAYAETIQATSLEMISTLADQYTYLVNDDNLFDNINEDLFDIDDSGISGIELVAPVKPELSNIVIVEAEADIGTVPALDLSEIGNIDSDVTTYAVEKPAINIMDMPDDVFPVFTKDAPGLSEILIPVKPISKDDLPAIPRISDKVIPAPPEFVEHEFTGIAPVDTLTAPETMFVYNEAEYDSDIKRKLEEDLLARLIAGGTGLDEDTENAIWDRAKERQKQENDEAYQSALTFFSSRGFSLPPGQLNARLRAVQVRIDQNNQNINNDILVQSSNLAQNNNQFIITQAIQLEKNLMDNSNQVANRAFEKAKAIVQFIHDAFQLSISHLGMKWEGYKALAQVYEIKIRAEIAKAERYRMLIEGIEAGTRSEALLIQAYDSTIKGISTLIQMYATEMEAAKIQSEIDMNKVSVYQAESDVFVKKINAITAKYTARQIQISGEETKIKMYEAENRAYETQTAAKKNIADLKLAGADLKLKGHMADIETLKIALEKYQIETNVILARAETEFKAAGLDVEVFKAENEKYKSDIDALIKSYLGKIDAAKAESDLLIKERELAIQKLLGEKKITSEQILSMSRIAGQLGAAALTSTSASTNIGFSHSRTQSESDSTSRTGSESFSVSHNVNYQGEGSAPSNPV